jgi:hypothetical protein
MSAAATKSMLDGNASFPPAAANMGLIPFWVEREVAAIDFDHADDNWVIAGPFPDVAYFPNAAGMLFAASLSDLTDADLDVTFGFGGTDGVLDYALLAVVDFGVTAATCNSMTESLDAQPAFIDIGGLYLVAEVVNVAGANPAAGTFQVGGYYTQNVIKSDDSE